MNSPAPTVAQRLVPLALAVTASVVALVVILVVGGAIVGAGAVFALVAFVLCVAGCCAWAVWRVRKYRGV